MPRRTRVGQTNRRWRPQKVANGAARRGRRLTRRPSRSVTNRWGTNTPPENRGEEPDVRVEPAAVGAPRAAPIAAPGPAAQHPGTSLPGTPGAARIIVVTGRAPLPDVARQILDAEPGLAGTRKEPDRRGHAEACLEGVADAVLPVVAPGILVALRTAGGSLPFLLRRQAARRPRRSRPRPRRS